VCVRQCSARHCALWWNIVLCHPPWSQASHFSACTFPHSYNALYLSLSAFPHRVRQPKPHKELYIRIYPSCVRGFPVLVLRSISAVCQSSKSFASIFTSGPRVDRRFGRAPLLDTIVNFAPTPNTPSDRLQFRWLRYTRHWTISDAHSMRDFLFPTCPFLSDSDAPWKSVALVLVRACAGLRSKGPTRTR